LERGVNGDAAYVQGEKDCPHADVHTFAQLIELEQEITPFSAFQHGPIRLTTCQWDASFWDCHCINILIANGIQFTQGCFATIGGSPLPVAQNRLSRTSRHRYLYVSPAHVPDLW